MTKKLLFVTAILLVVAIGAFAADVTGKWTYTMQGRDGTPREMSITLKQDGNTLTGSVPGMGRGGQGGTPTEITNGKVDGDNVSFNVVREFQGNKVTIKYSGVISGDEMKLTIETGRGPQQVTAKRGTT